MGKLLARGVKTGYGFWFASCRTDLKKRGVRSWRKHNDAGSIPGSTAAVCGIYAPAQDNLGVMYDKGAGVPADTEEARKWYRLAAEQGYGSAAANLAANFADADSAKPDLTSAYFWTLVSLHYPAVLSPPLQPPVVANLRARLSSEEATRIEAQVQDWLKAHPLGPDTAHDDWFTFLFTDPNAANAP